MHEGWWLLPPLVLAVLGGWLVARHHGLWFDELYTAEVARLPLREIVGAAVRGEGTIPYLLDAPPSYSTAYYVATHMWLSVTGLAADETGLRLLSLGTSVAAMGVFCLAVARLSGRRVALVAGLICSANPFVVQFAAEARGYGLALLATALAALGLAGWLEGRRRALWLYGLAGAAAGLAHWFALLVLGSFALAALVLRRREAMPVAAVTAAASVPALGMVGLAVANGVGASGAEWISEVGLAVPRLFVETWSGHRLPLLLATLATVIAGVVPGRAEGRETRMVALAWFGLPLLVVTALELVRPVFVARYLLPATLGLAVLMALGVTRLPRLAAGLSLAAVLAASLWSTVAVVRRGPREDVRGAVAAVAARHLPGEPVVAAARWDALGVDHYVRRHHARLADDLVLPPATVPSPSRAVWVVRRVGQGVKGDADKLIALETDLRGRGMRTTLERRFEGRAADVIVQRWELALP